MIWIGTSGWIYPHWVGRFYPPELPASEHLSFYARHFLTVEINRSFYRLPTYNQFQHWGQQVQHTPDFLFAVKASRYITHMKKLHAADDGVQRLISAAQGLGQHLGPFLYQLPPHWHANPERLAQFATHLPRTHRAAFEFRDASWFQPGMLPALQRILHNAGAALVLSVGGELPTPPDLPSTATFCYIRVHHGAQGIGLSDDELASWEKRLRAEHAAGHDTYIYFNNDAEAHAVLDARRLQQRLADLLPPLFT
ncbi:MAG: DUF72 domain-containing protein [Ktedonobacteraceae bacterium]|nr:DUF72 domain-containing protein [Ktedonobacteraceae bacterium]